MPRAAEETLGGQTRQLEPQPCPILLCDLTQIRSCLWPELSHLYKELLLSEGPVSSDLNLLPPHQDLMVPMAMGIWSLGKGHRSRP